MQEFIMNTPAVISSSWRDATNPQEIRTSFSLAQNDILIYREGSQTSAFTTNTSPVIVDNGEGIVSIPLTAEDLNFAGIATIIIQPPAVVLQSFRVRVVPVFSHDRMVAIYDVARRLDEERLTAERSNYLDKLNVSGTLAHSDAANIYQADVSALALETTAQAIKTKSDNLPASPAAQSKLDALESRLTASRAGNLDKLNIAGTLAHSGDANLYKADISSLATTAQLNARTLPADQYFDPAEDMVKIAPNGVSALSLSDAAIAKIEAAFLDEEDGVAFKDALMSLIQNQLDVNDLTALTIADTVISRLFSALVADHSSVANSWGQRFSRIPNAAPGTSGGLPTVDAANHVAGIQGTLTNLDQLDSVQDAQHLATQAAIAALQNLSTSDVENVLSTLGYTSTLATNIATTNNRVDVAISTRSTLTAQLVWDYGTRSLTSFSSLVTSIWSHATRTLTAFSFSPAPANAADTTAIKAVADRLNGMIETDSGQQRFTAKSLELGPSGTIIGGGDASAAKQDEILSRLNAIGDGAITVVSHQPTSDSICLIRGDSYTAANHRPLKWTNSTGAAWPDLAGATIRFTAIKVSDAGKLTSAVPTARKIEANCYLNPATIPAVEVLCDLTPQDTDREEGLYEYDVEATLPDGSVQTLVTTAAAQKQYGSQVRKLTILPHYTQPSH